jgi:hypothetical protein
MTPDQDQEQKYKTAFAEALLRYPNDPGKAAFEAIPDVGTAVQAARNWVNDSFVRAEKIRLLEQSGLKAFLPTKEAQASDIYTIAKDVSVDFDVRLRAHRLYAEVMGHIEKPDTSVKVNVLNQSVMVVKDLGSNEDWERKAEMNQRKLIYGDSTAAN